MSMQPMAVYGIEVPAGDVAISARPDIPSAFRITMAAIDPSAEPEGEDGAVPRATLKVIRQNLFEDDEEDYDDDSDDGFDAAEMERILAAEASDESSEDDEEVNGGPSDPSKSKKAKRAAVAAKIKKMIAEEGMDVDEESDDEEISNGVNGVNGVAKSAKSKGKMPASDSDEDEDEIDSDDDMGEEEFEEFVLCTLDPNKLYQQPLDITFGEDERVWFKVSGTHSIFLTGNYVEPVGAANGMYDPDSDDENEYDLEPDEEEIDDEDLSEGDELDDMEDPRITELDDEVEAPKLIEAKPKKEAKAAKANKNKRSAPESDEDEAGAGAEGLDAMMTEAALPASANTNGEKKLTKSERKELKKLKKNNGEAAAAPAAAEKNIEPPSSQKSDKKVQFAEKLEQGPTPTKAPEKAADSAKAKATGPRNVQGVTIDDKKLGAGQAAKNGDRISMRYIGKLKDSGKQFDANKKGPAFKFKLGAGEVIKGWEIGIKGMQIGGERRITIPASLGYGSKGAPPDIPPNAALVFDVKLLTIN